LGDGAEAQKVVVELLKRLGKWVEPEKKVRFIDISLNFSQVFVRERFDFARPSQSDNFLTFLKPLTLSQEGITVYIKDKDEDMDMYRVKGYAQGGAQTGTYCPLFESGFLRFAR
jgi:hypothetical protein